MPTSKKPGMLRAAALGVLIAACPPSLYAQVTVAGHTPGTFRTTDSGAAEYRIPIRVPPGIAGMEPKLSLVFSSQRGNGLLGLGWVLDGLSVIHRCPKSIVQDGIAGGINFDSHDRYCMDGQRLVAVSGSYGADGTQYRTERESFAKVVSYGGGGSEPLWFKVWTKAGQILEFGNSGSSRIVAQGKNAARTWALNKVSDTTGNYFDITYDSASGDFFPTRIDYTGNAAGGVVPFASVRFSYDPRTDAKPTYLSGVAITTTNRLKNLTTYVGETAVADYRLAYEYSPNGGPSRITSITECSGDGTQCFNPTTFGWQNSAGGGGSAVAWPGAGPELGATGAVGDFNGDGRADFVFHGAGGAVSIKYSTGSGFQSPVPIGTLPIITTSGGVCGCETEYARYIVGDVDGDGRADLIMTNGTVWLSQSSGFVQVSWPGVPDNITWWNYTVADFNGDGRADLLLLVNPAALYLHYSTGSGFQSPSYVGTLPVVGLGGECGCEPDYAQHVAGDFDGNGRADIATTAGTAWLSTPSGFTQVSWPGAGPGRAFDFNGDGLADIVTTPGQGTIAVRISTGNGFEPQVWLGEPPPDTAWIAGDFEGDGRTDFLLSSGTAWKFPAGTPDLVTSILTSLGAAISITYKPLTDSSVYAKDSDAVFPVRDLQNEGPLRVVSSTSFSNGIGGNSVTDYFYRGAKAHLRGGGFLGFRQVQATDTATGIKTVNTFRQDYPYHGLGTQALRKQASETVIGQADNTWTGTLLTPAPGSGGIYHKVQLTQSVERSYELNGNPLTTVTANTAYDAFGNAVTVTIGTGDGYSKVTSNAYTNDTSNWFLGRLTSSSVTSTKPPSESIVRTAAFAYHATTGLLTKEVVEPGDSNFCLVTEYGYDAFGNKSSVTTRNCNGSPGEAAAPVGDAVFAARSSNTNFLATAANLVPGQFPTSSSNALGHSEAREFDRRFGAVTKLTGPNALATAWTYDRFGRKSFEGRADGTSTTVAYALCGTGTCPANGRYFVTMESPGRPTSISYFDVLNREIRSETQGVDGTWVRKDTEYDALGRVRRASQPYFAGSTPKWSCFGYDLLGRVTSASGPTDTNDNASCDSTATTITVYNGLTTTVTNALNQTETRVKNSQGQLVQVIRQ